MAYTPENSNGQPISINDQFDLLSIQSDIDAIRQSILSSMPEADIQCRESWIYTYDQYAFVGLLIDHEVILYWVKGHVQKEDCESVASIMQDVIDNAGNKGDLIQILDLSHIHSFSLSARKSYETINEQLSPCWKKSYYIFSGIGNTIYRIYAAINPMISQRVTLAKSIPQALNLLLKSKPRPQKEREQTFDPEKASREELIAQYKKLEEECQKKLSEDQKKADLILKNIAKTSWDRNFDIHETPFSQEDPFYNVFEALSLLKQDLGEIYEQQRQHNNILEEEVAQRTNQLSAVIENTSDMIMSVDHQWRVQVVNTAFQYHFRKFQGIDIKVGDELLSLYKDKSNLEYWKSRFQRAFGGERFQEQANILLDGKNIHFELTYNPIRKPGQQQVTEVSVFGRNITDLRQAEETAKENEANLTRALKIASAGSWELNLFTGELIIGKEGLRVLDIPDQEELRMSIEDFVSQMLYPEDIPLLRERIEYARSQIDDPSFHDQFQYRLVKADGQVLHLMLYSRFKSGKRGIIYGITQNITQQKEAEEQLLQQNATLRKVNSELDHFVYSVSHDLRAPLASVLGLINIARMEEDPEVVRHYLTLKEKSIRKLDTYIQEIIDISKNARLSVSHDQVDFLELIEDVYEEQHYDQASRQILKLKDVRQQQYFVSDYKRLRVVLQNLVSNALRYANVNQPEPYVKVSVQTLPGEALLTIEDNGMGIQTVHLPKIFDMFYRANHVRTGSGLGLYIVKETLDRLGGEISVTSQPGIGTKFTVKISDLRD